MTIEYDDFTSPPRKKRKRVELDEVLQNHPDTALVTVGDLLAKSPPETIAAVRERLQQVPRARLEWTLSDALERRQRVAAWFINREYTRRGVPPAFRRALDINFDDAELLMDALAIDLEWIASRYPQHVTFFGRWRKFTNPRYFHSQTRYIFNGSGRGKFPMHKLLKGLSLSTDQQRECHYLKSRKTDNQQQELLRMMPAISDELEGHHMIRLHRTRGAVVHLLPDDRAIIQRRVNVWFCANLADWKPTRTADLYNALTGAKDATDEKAPGSMSRQKAHNVMQDLVRDLPKKDARPW